MLSFSSRAHAYTWMIKHGYSNCGACHSDPSGGELLTVYGRAMSEAFLSSKFGGDSESSADSFERRQMARFGKAAAAKLAKPAAEQDEADAEEEEELDEEEEEAAADSDGEDASSGESDSAPAASETEEPASERSFTDPFFGLFGLPESILLGGSVRLATIYNGEADTKVRWFPMQLDLYGELRVSESFRAQASLGVSKVKAGAPHGRAAQITTNQGDGYRLISRTHWLAFDFGGGNHTIRAGRINLPYGLRIPEHTMWVRERTETDRESDQQHGLSLAMNFEKVRFELMAIAGNYQSSPDEFRERGYSGYIEMMVGDRAAFGLSSLVTYAKNDRLAPSDNRSTTRQAHGAFFRAGVGEMLAVLGEVDMVARSRKELGYTGLLQLDFEFAQGLHLIGTVEGANTSYPSNPRTLVGTAFVEQERLPGTGELQMGYWAGAQWFFAPHFDFRVDAMFRQEEPMQILGQLHVYL
ncbi:MAG: hypothetical protein M3020_14610 [Myxococcota bacterium]|nr:hypothetical protein [Myxococcota bacterium]